MLTLQSLITALATAVVTNGPNNSDAATEIDGVTSDSRAVRSGSLFVAVVGSNIDGHRYIPAAVKKGAVAVLGTTPYVQLLEVEIAPPATVPYLQVENSRNGLAIATAALNGFPSQHLIVIGVTGTDGKTTTSSLLEAILVAATQNKPMYPAGRVGVITTVGARICGEARDTGLHVTTPDSSVVQAYLAEMHNQGCTSVVVESTSHGLDQRRVDAIDFDIAAVTNITHEHLDYHGTRAAYVTAKAMLFRKLYEPASKAQWYDANNFWQHRCAVLNADDVGSFDALRAVLAEESAEHGFSVPQRSYAIHNSADVTATEIRYQPNSTQFRLTWWGGEFEIVSPLIGEFNLHNVLCAATVALALGVEANVVQRGLAKFPGVLGRMERIACGQPFLALVDFAHTPVSLERALHTLRPLLGVHPDGTPGRLIAVFGSAGLRDHAKRRLMGQVSGRLADFTVITAEDPRTEDVHAINQEIAAGVAEHVSKDRFTVVADRGLAISFAINLAEAGDIVAAFGKGHERSMCFGTTEYPWSDQQTMREALIRRLSGI